jgi:outer membrane protein OmpA-like peptidoglycan-associated protein
MPQTITLESGTGFQDISHLFRPLEAAPSNLPAVAEPVATQMATEGTALMAPEAVAAGTEAAAISAEAIAGTELATIGTVAAGAEAGTAGFGTPAVIIGGALAVAGVGAYYLWNKFSLSGSITPPAPTVPTTVQAPMAPPGPPVTQTGTAAGSPPPGAPQGDPQAAAHFQLPFAGSRDHRILNAYFKFDQYDLTPQAREAIAKDAKEIEASGALKVTATGHTDTMGSDPYNQHLSELRAQSVKEELEKDFKKDGYDNIQVDAEGVGKGDQEVTTSDQKREDRNRRVTLKVEGSKTPESTEDGQKAPKPPAQTAQNNSQTGTTPSSTSPGATPAPPTLTAPPFMGM